MALLRTVIYDRPLTGMRKAHKGIAGAGETARLYRFSSGCKTPLQLTPHRLGNLIHRQDHVAAVVAHL